VTYINSERRQVKKLYASTLNSLGAYFGKHQDLQGWVMPITRWTLDNRTLSRRIRNAGYWLSRVSTNLIQGIVSVWYA